MTEPLAPTAVLVSAPISFDPSDPGPPLPTVQVAPDAGLVNGQQVAVHVSGFSPGVQVIVAQCQVDPPEVIHCANSQFLDTDGSGEADADFTVRRVLASSGIGIPGTPFDCATGPGACGIYTQLFGDPVLTNFAPINFDPTVPLPSSGLTASPLDDLVDGQTVTVTGHLDAGDSLGLAVCRDDPSPSSTICDQSTARFVTPDAAGDVHVDVVVHDVLHTAAGDVDCLAAPGTCVIVLASIGPQTVARFPLSFRVVVAATPLDSVAPEESVIAHQLAFTGHNTSRLTAAGIAAVLVGIPLASIGRRRNRPSL